MHLGVVVLGVELEDDALVRLVRAGVDQAAGRPVGPARFTVLDLRRAGRQQFLRVAQPEAAPAWSPDGSRLVFVAPYVRKPLVGVVDVSDERAP